MYHKRADIYTTQGGDKMQGLFITFDSRNKRHAQNKAYGTNRDKIVYQNQVGGIGIRLPTNIHRTASVYNFNPYEPFTPANTEDFNLAIAYYFTTSSTSSQEEALTTAGYTLDSIGQFGQDTQTAISNWNTHNVTSMDSTFLNQTTFNIDIRLWDTSQVTNMYQMFQGATDFNQDIGSWNTSKVTTMEYLFHQSPAFNKDISSWDVGNVINMLGMFHGATIFNQDIGGWNTSSVTNMQSMFYGATAFNQDIRLWVVGNVKAMNGMFHGASDFDQNITIWTVESKTVLTNMFALATKMFVIYYDPTTWVDINTPTIDFFNVTAD
jgi:surface protein